MPLNPIAFGCLLSGAAGVAFVVALRNLLRARASVSWPTAEATIVDARVVAGNKGSRPKIVYRYRMADMNHESDRIVVGGLWETSGDGPARLVQKHPKGSLAAVAVDPRSPGFSVLVPGVRFHQVFTVVLCVVIFLATLPALWAFTRLGAAP